jgi:hypothetical protein
MYTDEQWHQLYARARAAIASAQAVSVRWRLGLPLERVVPAAPARRSALARSHAGREEASSRRATG